MASTSRWAGTPKRLENFAGCEVGTSQGVKLGHRRVRSWDIAGCEVWTSQGAKLRHRRVRNVGAALGDFSSRYRVVVAVDRVTYISEVYPFIDGKMRLHAMFTGVR